MGCWATDSFGNDDAADWLADLVVQRDLRLVEDAMKRVLMTEDPYLQAPDATQALAAAEVVAAALGRPGAAANTQESLVKWLAQVKPQPASALIDKTRAAIDRILADDSELNGLWRDTDEYPLWLQDVQALRHRLDA